MLEANIPPTYQFHVSLIGISPMIWRRLLVSGSSTIADLHYILQIAMGWSNEHLNRFTIHGKHYGVYHPGGIIFNDDPAQVCLADLQLREREKFLYEYDLSARWQHQLRVEAIAYSDQPSPVALCLAGQRAAPPEECGGAWDFLAKRQYYSAGYALEILADIQDNGVDVLKERYDEIRLLLRWLSLEQFDCQVVNRQLQQYTRGDRNWMFAEELNDADQSSACL